MRVSKTAEDSGAIYSRVELIFADDMAIAPIDHHANTLLPSGDIKGRPCGGVENMWCSRNLYRIAQQPRPGRPSLPARAGGPG